jgi:GT2 family glycosyltransferase
MATQLDFEKRKKRTSNFGAVDVIIPTKERYHLLPRAVWQAKTMIPFNRVIVVDSSEHPDLDFLRKLNVDYILTPNAKLGFARKSALSRATTDYVVSLDDDIIIEGDWFKNMLKHFDDPTVAAANSHIAFFDPNHPELAELFRHSRDSGASSGAMIMNRRKVLSIGGWNSQVHRGEDFELSLRLAKNGLKWKVAKDTQALHPVVCSEFIERAYMQGSGIVSLAFVGMTSKAFLFFRSFGSALVMPFYYFLKCRDVKVFKLYLLYRLCYALGLFKTMFGISRKWSLLGLYKRLMKIEYD